MSATAVSCSRIISPIHDDACFEEGRLMKQAIYGTEDEKQDAVNTLTVMNGRMKKMLKKYFAF